LSCIPQIDSQTCVGTLLFPAKFFGQNSKDFRLNFFAVNDAVQDQSNLYRPQTVFRRIGVLRSRCLNRAQQSLFGLPLLPRLPNLVNYLFHVFRAEISAVPGLRVFEIGL